MIFTDAKLLTIAVLAPRSPDKERARGVSRCHSDDAPEAVRAAPLGESPESGFAPPSLERRRLQRSASQTFRAPSSPPVARVARSPLKGQDIFPANVPGVRGDVCPRAASTESFCRRGSRSLSVAPFLLSATPKIVPVRPGRLARSRPLVWWVAQLFAMRGLRSCGASSMHWDDRPCRRGRLAGCSGG